MRGSIQDNNQAIKLTHDYYQKLLVQSTFIEQELSSFSSILSKTYVSLALKQPNWKNLTLKQTKDIKQRIWSMMDKIKEKLQRQCQVIVEVTSCIRKVSHQFKQLVDIMKNEQQKSWNKMAELQSQLHSKQKEISKCQFAIEEEKNKISEQQWRRLHYVKPDSLNFSQIQGLTYIKVLKDVRVKLDYQMTNQRKEQKLFNDNIISKLQDFKNKIIKIWYILPYFPQQSHMASQLSNNNDSQIGREISELERRYLKRQKEIDEFQVSKLADIKKKLKLLEQAQMSESREYRYSLSADNQNYIESEVVELLNS